MHMRRKLTAPAAAVAADNRLYTSILLKTVGPDIEGL